MRNLTSREIPGCIVENAIFALREVRVLEASESAETPVTTGLAGFSSRQLCTRVELILEKPQKSYPLSHVSL